MIMKINKSKKKILIALCSGSQAIADIVFFTELSRDAVHRNLKQLVQAGMVAKVSINSRHFNYNLLCSYFKENTCQVITKTDAITITDLQKVSGK